MQVARKMAAKKRLQKNCKDMASKNGLNSWGKIGKHMAAQKRLQQDTGKI